MKDIEMLVEFTYYVEEIPYRCRKPRNVEKRGAARITIPHKNICDSKIVFVVKDYNEEIVIRTWGDGNLYCVATENDGAGSHNLTKNELRQKIEAFSRSNFGVSTHNDVVAKIQKRADEYVVAGEIYVKIPEPMYCIYTFGLGHNHGGTAMSIDYRYNENISADRYFNALQFDEAVKTATKIALDRGDDESVSRFENTYFINVVDASYVKRNPKKEHGNGNPLHNEFEEIIKNSSSIEDATVGVIARAMI